MGKGGAGLSVEMDGMAETIKAVQGLERELRTGANKELRAAAGRTAGGLAADLQRAAVSSGVPVAPRVASSVRVKSDRLPVVVLGGPKRVGGGGDRAPAARLLWGSEQGPKSDPNRFAVEPNPAGYWIAPTVARFRDGPALDTFRRAVFETLHSYKLI